MNEFNTDSLFTLNTTSGAATLVGANGVGNENIVGLAIDQSTDTLYGVSELNNQLYTIDQSSGAASVVGNVGFDAVNNGLAFRTVGVPEPSAFSALALFGMVAACRRNCRKSGIRG